MGSDVIDVRRLEHHIDGRWIAAGGEAAALRSPSTGEVVAEVPLGTTEDVDRAVAAARAAQPAMARLSVRARARLLRAVAAVLERDRQDVARDLSLEQGKPLYTEALAEVDIAVEMWRDAADIISHLPGEVLPSADPGKQVLVVHEPRGTYGVITPWNFPATIPTEYLCAGLAAGNAIVWKPSELTPLTAIHLARCCEEAGIPAGALNLVLGDGAGVGHAIAAHPGIDAIGLTGSPATGDAVARTAGAKPLLLELGGNNATIVLDDADFDRAARRLASSCFANAGQICSSTERILVHESLHDRLAGALADAARHVRLGPSLDPETTMGPLNNAHTADKVDRHLADARDRGARVLVGGERDPGFPTPLYYRPTIVDGLTPEMLLFREETFGPVAGLVGFADVDEAVALANDNALGLIAGVFTTDPSRAREVAARLQVGIVNVNETATYWEPHTPFGGYSGKRSGVGRLGGKYTILEMSQTKTIVLDHGGGTDEA